jgi:hypothetical protein
MKSVGPDVRYENINCCWSKLSVIIAKIEQPIQSKIMWDIDSLVHHIVVIMLDEYYEQE